MPSLSTFAILVISFGMACSKVGLKGDGQSKGGPQPLDASADRKAAEDERVDPPSNIAGSYLHCAIEEEPEDGEVVALLGCRFDDSSGKRVALNSIAEASTFTHRPAAVPSLRVYLRALEGDSRYDAVYLFIADTRDAVLQAVQDTRIFVEMTNIPSGPANASVSGLVKDIRIEADAIPEARETDYRQIRDELLIEASGEEPPPPPPED